MGNSFEETYDAAAFRSFGHEIVDRLADQLQTSLDRNEPVLKFEDPEQLLQKWESLEKGEFDREAFFDLLFQNAIRLHHPGYVGHQVAPVIPETAVLDFVSSFLNNGVGVYEMGSPAVILEKLVIDKLSAVLNWTASGGFLTSGGTLANLTCLLAIRQIKAKENVWEDGQHHKYGILVSESAHYCMDRAVRIMGWGEAGLIKVLPNDEFRLSAKSLTKAKANAEEQGIHVIGLVANACSTATGTYENLQELATFCKAEDLWFHVDAAHGFPVVFSKKYQGLIEGLSLADSFIADFHKMMLVPSLATAVVFKNSDDSFAAFRQKADYLWEDAEAKDWYMLGKRTFECTKSMMAIKAYYALKKFGPSFYESFINHTFDMSRAFAKMIQSEEQLELLCMPEANIICYRFKASQNPNEVNQKIRVALRTDGDFFIVQTMVQGDLYLRSTLMNPLTKEKDLNDLLISILRLGNLFNLQTS